MRFSLKASLVVMLGLFAVADPGRAAETEVSANPCGSIFCLQGSACPLDVDGWCAARVWGPCPGSNVCNVGYAICFNEPFDIQITCGDGET